MAKTKHNLPETKGLFQVRGLVTGVLKDSFITNKVTKTGKDMYILNFGVKTKEDRTIYVSLNGMEQDNVYFYARPKEKGEKGVTKKVPWEKRKDFNEEGFKLIGINVGITKKINNKGIEVNDNQVMTDYDACQFISEKLQDDESIFVKGNIEYSHYTKQNGEVGRNEKFTINQISLCKSPIDLSKEDYNELNDFEQTIILVDAKKDDSDKKDMKGIITAKIVTYSSIEDAEYIVRNLNLFKNLKTLKPYTAIKVSGKINYRIQEDEVNEDDYWGEKNSFERVTGTIKELEITGADPKTRDKEVYSKDKIEEAIRVLTEFGENNNTSGEEQWGEQSSIDSSSDDGGWD